MKLSTRARYGIHAMYDLALCGNDKPQPLKAIAERQMIPEAYLEQLMGVLRKEKLVTSTRGAFGGYVLALPPKDISVGMIIRALEGDLCITDCLKFEDSCAKSGLCPTRLVVQKVHDGVNAIVDGISLQDMIDSYERGTPKGDEK